MKFKVGDIVRFKDRFECSSLRPYPNLYNQKGTIVSATSHTRIEWLVFGDETTWISHPDQLELAKEQVVKSIINDILAN